MLVIRKRWAGKAIVYSAYAGDYCMYSDASLDKVNTFVNSLH